MAGTGPVSQSLLEWKGVTYTVKQKSGEKPVLHDVTGYAAPGTLTAILGASGAGKSSLLNILADRLLATKGGTLEGELRLNGEPLPSNYRARCAYVLQTEALYAFSSVQETIEMAARMRLGNMNKEEKKARARELIDQLGLTKAKDTRIGDGNRISGISGGERKRVAIACEIVDSPSLLMLDEPTSGLDSHQALRVVKSLKELAQTGRTVVASIHQPGSAIYATFDNIIVLAEGKMAYFGPAADLVPHFTRIELPCPSLFNPADHVLQITSVDRATPEEESKSNMQLERIFQHANSTCKFQPYQQYQIGTMVQDTREPCSYSEQFSLLFSRIFRDYARNVFANVIKVANGLITSIIMVALYKNMNDADSTIVLIQNKQALLFFICINGLFGPLFGTIQAFAPEVSVVLRERMGNLYSVGPYYLAKLLVALPFELIPLLITNTVSFWWLDLNHSGGRYFFFVAFSASTALSSISVAFTLAVAANGNVQAASAGVGPIAIILLLLGGFYINLSTIPPYVRWISEISYLSFSYQGLCINEFGGDENGGRGEKLIAGGEVAYGNEVLSKLFKKSDKSLFNDAEYWEEEKLHRFLYILVWVLVMNFFAYFVLLVKGPKYLRMSSPSWSEAQGPAQSYGQARAQLIQARE